MTITKLRIRNFKGQTRDLDVPAKGLLIEGKNGAGKTTMLDAICWCLFGKFYDRTETSPKPNDEKGFDITCDVEVVLETSEGEFGRKYSEIWKKPRGKINKRFAGHATDYYLDTLKVKAREYEGKVSSLFSEEEFFVTAIPGYFGNALHWQARRKYLSSLVEEPTPGELMLKEPDLSEVVESGKDNDYYEKKLKQLKIQLKSCNEERDPLPDRIDECRRSIVETPPIEAIEEDLHKMKDKLSAIKNGAVDPSMQHRLEQLHDLRTGLFDSKTNAIMEARKAYSESREAKDKSLHEKAELIARQLTTTEQEASSLRQEIFKFKSNMEEVAGQIKEYETQIVTKNSIVGKLSLQIQEIKEGLNDVKPDSELCSLCGQRLPQKTIEMSIESMKDKIKAKIESMREEKERAEEAKKKATQLHKARKAELGAIKKVLEDTTKKLTERHKDLEELQGKSVEIEDKRRAIKKELEAYYYEKVERIETNFTQDKKAIDHQINELSEKMKAPDTSEIEEDIEELNEQKAQSKHNQSMLRRIEELTKKNRELSQRQENLLKLIYLYELRLKTWAQTIEDSLNSLFKIARFKLFEIQVNGEIKEVCKAIYKGRETMSQGEGLLVGIEIADTFAKAWNVSPPLLADNMQNLTFNAPTDRQAIKTRTTLADKLTTKEL